MSMEDASPKCEGGDDFESPKGGEIVLLNI